MLFHNDCFFNFCCLLRQRFSAAYLFKLFLLPQHVHTTLFISCVKPELTRWCLCSLHAGIQTSPNEVVGSRDGCRHSIAESIILTLIIQSMQTAPQDLKLTDIGVKLLELFCRNIDAVRDAPPMRVFNVTEAEGLLLNAMKLHYLSAEIQQNSMAALLHLRSKCPEHMRPQNSLLLDTTLDAMKSHGITGFVFFNAIHVIETVLPIFGDPDAGTPNADTARKLLDGTQYAMRSPHPYRRAPPRQLWIRNTLASRTRRSMAASTESHYAPAGHSLSLMAELT